MANNNIVLTTGGLGPTKDDITKKALCDYFNCKLVSKPEVLENISRLLNNKGRQVIELNREQAMVPENCIVLQNIEGTAPGMWFKHGDKIFVSMPGVPFEMEYLMQYEVLPRLQNTFKLPVIIHRTLHTTGIPESVLANLLDSWEQQLPADLKVAYLPSPGDNRIRLSITGLDANSLNNVLDSEVQKLYSILKTHIFSDSDRTIQEVVSAVFREAGKTVVTAESCTGGNIAHLLTLVAGCSEYFKGSIVAYSNDVKEHVLGVKNESLNDFGAVSQTVVEQMACGVRKLLNADYAVATSGVAGPDGGSLDKPVGTVWIAVCSVHKTVSAKHHFGIHRGRNIQRASITALNMLLQLFSEETHN